MRLRKWCVPVTRRVHALQHCETLAAVPTALLTSARNCSQSVNVFVHTIRKPT